MADHIDSNLLEKLQAAYAAAPPKYQSVITNDETWKTFIARFPAEKLHTLSLEDYCLGKGSIPENFSWYIERGLQSALGRYSPGSARGHLIYKKSDETYYRIKNFDDKSDHEAMSIVLRMTQLIAQSNSLLSAQKWDSNLAIEQELNSDVRIAIGHARRLRLFHAYNPEKMLAINSPTHLKHFLKIFGYEEVEPSVGPFALAKLLWDRYLTIKDRFPDITPKGFSDLLYLEELGIRPQKREKNINSHDDLDVVDITDIPRNTILFGPPGTGKTYETVTRAVQILDRNFYLMNKDSRSLIHHRFTELLNRGHIGFVTFHQSFSYEEFVEGLKVQTTDNGSVRYEIEDGIFKTLCLSAASKVTAGKNKSVSIDGKRIWKMSLGNTQGDDAFIFDECIESNSILLGYGYGIDFTDAKSKAEIYQRYEEARYTDAINDYPVTSVTRFIQEMQIGDIVVISDGNRKFRAIGEITSNYTYLPRQDSLSYCQKRSVNWLRVYKPSRPFEDLMNNIFSQMTLYELKVGSIDIERLKDLLAAEVETARPSAEINARVMIIDEINRGNISKIFGELITLIEENKRAGQSEAIETRLPYSKTLFSVPDNIYIVGTMNTADRSLTGMDTALRRRFSFIEIEPDPDLLALINVDGIEIGRLLAVINKRIELLLGREFLIGHSYFLPLTEDPSISILNRIFSGAIIPQLREYFFDDWEKIHCVLGDHQKRTTLQIITRKYNDEEVAALLGNSLQNGSEEIWEINEDALDEPDSYIGIYQAQRGRTEVNATSGDS